MSLLFSMLIRHAAAAAAVAGRINTQPRRRAFPHGGNRHARARFLTVVVVTTFSAVLQQQAWCPPVCAGRPPQRVGTGRYVVLRATYRRSKVYQLL